MKICKCYDCWKTIMIWDVYQVDNQPYCFGCYLAIIETTKEKEDE